MVLDICVAYRKARSYGKRSVDTARHWDGMAGWYEEEVG